MELCDNCLCLDVCDGINRISAGLLHECKHFKDRSKFIELPYEPIPIVNDGTGFNSDCYCPKCGVNLSGCYADGTEEPLNVIQCYNCGLVCDNTKTIAKEPAKQALKERENNANT